MEIILTDTQVGDLARPLVGILHQFYANPENEKEFQKWLNERNEDEK